jgi:hypothetical protein
MKGLAEQAAEVSLGLSGRLGKPEGAQVGIPVSLILKAGVRQK